LNWKEKEGDQSFESSLSSEQGLPSKMCRFSPERAFQAMKLKPDLGNKISESTIITDTLPSHLKEMAKLLCNHQLAFMIDKASDGIDSVPIDFTVFKERYVGRMDKAAVLLCQQTFSSISEAQLVLCQMIRCFVLNMSAVQQRTRPTKPGSTTTFLCSAVSKKEKTETHVEEETVTMTPCKWRASLFWNSKTGLYSFGEIPSFEEHCEHCLRYHSRFTKTEVDFQENYPCLQEFFGRGTDNTATECNNWLYVTADEA